MMRKENEIEEGLKKLEAKNKEFLGKKLKFDLSGDARSLTKEIEKLVRATEICTLKWVLEKGGALNT